MWVKTRVANLLAALAGLGSLLLVEGLFQLGGLGPSDRLFVRAEQAGGEIYRSNRAATYRFFQRQYRRHSPLELSFAAAKPPDAVRVFALGASTLVGFPHPVSAAFPNFLEKMLAAAYPGRRFELINCGITALNTFCLVDFMREIATYDPDLVIVYAGHNEFMGPYGVTTPFVRFGNDRRLIRLHMELQRSRIYYYLGEFIAALRDWSGGAGDSEAFGLHLAREEIGVLDPGYARTAENYRANLEEIAAIAAARGIPLLFSTLVANLANFHPLRSECDEMTPVLGAAMARGEWAAVEHGVRTALREKPYCANLHFELGRVYYRRGEYAAARSAFAQARDMDRLPFRAPTLFNQILREVAVGSGAMLANAEAAFAAAAPHGIAGSELVEEYVHPTVYGHYLIARAIFETVAASPLAAQWGARGALGGYSDYRPQYPLAEEISRRNDLMLFLKRMPYKVPPPALGRRLAELMDAQLAAIPRLSEAARRDFAARGGMRFLQRMTADLPPAARRRSQGELAALGEAF